MKTLNQAVTESGSQQALAEKLGVGQYQISRWLKRGAVVVDGVVYVKASKRQK